MSINSDTTTACACFCLFVVFLFFSRSCYRSCLSLCREHSLRTVAFSCISTGAYCYPAEEAADVALSSVRSWLLEGDNLEHVDRVVFVTRKARDQEAYAGLMMVYFPSPLLA